jgi:hypothetical protein
MNKLAIEILLLCSFIAFIFGLVNGCIQKTCEPKSVLATIALPHRLGCELTLQRFSDEEAR